MMVIFGVPAKHKTPDLLQFTAPCHGDLEYMRVIHDGSPNQYMVLVKFRSAAAAREFHAAYNGLAYNTMEPEVCCILPVAWVEHCKVR
jgi:BRCA1-associated protein